MKITKTLFTEFSSSPKLARWHVNNKITYDMIIEAEYGSMDGAEIGQSIEDQVKMLLSDHTIVTPEWDYDGSVAETHQLLAAQPAVIYQPWFESDGLLVRCDFLVRNESGTYDLREVKAKNTVRKDTKAKPLKDDLISDLSFQNYVLTQTLWGQFSGKCFLVYLNKEYVRRGDLDIKELIKIEDVTQELLSAEVVEQNISMMKTQLAMSQWEFESIYPYNGWDHLEYFGSEAPKNSIRFIPGIGTKKKALYQWGKTDILTLWEDELQILTTAKWEPSRASMYVQTYQAWQTKIDIEWVRSKIADLQYPLFFYDYETVSSPVPLFDGTSPWQHIIVQYSVHKIEADGTITHREALIEGQITDNQAIIDQLYTDLEWWNGTYIVWFKWFENARNEETAKMFPQYQEFLETVNTKTFDLMDVFSHGDYFDRGFKGSSSIKKVLPVLTDITYDGLDVPNGMVATWLLLDIATGKMLPDVLATHRKNLLTYCEQDTWAMVRIWQELWKKI